MKSCYLKLVKPINQKLNLKSIYLCINVISTDLRYFFINEVLRTESENRGHENKLNQFFKLFSVI